MGIEKRTYSVRLDGELAEKIKQYALLENRNFTNMVETILLQYVSEREKQEKENWPTASLAGGQFLRLANFIAFKGAFMV